MSGKESRDGRVESASDPEKTNRDRKQGGREDRERNFKKKIEILLARFGTTSRDIDVRDKINELVRDDSLVIPANLDFNKFFGKDPHRFHRKKLRLVALVNGKAVAHFLTEKRKSDFVLRDDSSVASKEEEEDFEDSPSSTTTSTTMDTSSKLQTQILS